MENTRSEITDITMRGVPNQLKTDIRTIAKNSGLTMSAYLKTKLREIVGSAPANLKRTNE